MKASDCSFEYMRKISGSIPELRYTTSFIQVEFGLKHLSDLWSIYTEVSSDSNETFKTKKAICLEFGIALKDLHGIEEPPPVKMGLKVDKAS